MGSVFRWSRGFGIDNSFYFALGQVDDPKTFSQRRSIGAVGADCFWLDFIVCVDVDF